MAESYDEFEELGHLLREDVEWRLLKLGEATGSPIERKFLVGLIMSARNEYIIEWSGNTWWDWPRVSASGTGPERLIISPQPKFLGIHPDFAVTLTDIVGGKATVFVECDGHDFHERTKEQAKRDRSRDRKIQGAGYSVLRFTGSEIHRHASRCGVETLRHLADQLERETRK